MADTSWEQLREKGDVLKKRGDVNGATEAYKGALNVGSSSLAPRERAILETRLAEALLAAHVTPAEVQNVALRAVAADPTFPMAHFQLAQALLAQGKPAWTTAIDMLAAALDHPTKIDAEMLLFKTLLVAGDANARLAALEEVLKDSRLGEAKRRLARAAKAAGVMDENGLETILKTLPAKGADRTLTCDIMGQEQINFGALLEAPLLALHDLAVRKHAELSAQVEQTRVPIAASLAENTSLEDVFASAAKLMQDGRLHEAAVLAECGAASQHALGNLAEEAVLLEFAADCSRDAGTSPEETARLLRRAFLIIADAGGPEDVGSYRLQRICHALAVAERCCGEPALAALSAAHAVQSAERALKGNSNAAGALLEAQATLAHCFSDLGIADMALELYDHICGFVEGVSEKQLASVDRSSETPVRLIAANVHFSRAVFFQKVGAFDLAASDFENTLSLHEQQRARLPIGLLETAAEFFERDRRDLPRAAALRALLPQPSSDQLLRSDS